MMDPLTHVDTGTLTYTVKHTWHGYDIYMDMNVMEEHVEIANLQQKEYTYIDVSSQSSTISQVSAIWTLLWSGPL